MSFIFQSHSYTSALQEITTVGLSYDSFQLFGFDFMIDQQYKVWLLEVNGAPAAARSDSQVLTA